MDGQHHPLGEDMNGLPVTHWQIKSSLADINSLQGLQRHRCGASCPLTSCPFTSSRPLKLLFILNVFSKPSACNHSTDFSSV